MKNSAEIVNNSFDNKVVTRFNTVTPKITNTERFLGLFFIISLSLSPHYLFSSGMPQISDYLLLFWTIFVMFIFPRFSFEKHIKRFLISVFLLVYYISLVSLTWSLFLSDLAVAKNILFYLFNFIIVLSLSIVLHQNPNYWKRVLKNAFLITTLSLLIGLVINFDFESFRQTAGFNNPNQLGYFSLLIVCGTIVLYGTAGFRNLKFWLILVFCSIFIVTSFSLTANVSLLLAYGGLLFLANTKKNKFWLFCGAVTILITALLLIGNTNFGEYLVEKGEHRINRVEKKTENAWSQRGYDRIFEFPMHNFFGAGEGALYRFGSGHTNEIHSTMGTLLFSYGIPGISLFTLVVFFVLKRAYIYTWIILAAPLAYSLTHQAIRSTLFWLLLATIIFYGQKRKSYSS